MKAFRVTFGMTVLASVVIVSMQLYLHVRLEQKLDAQIQRLCLP